MIEVHLPLRTQALDDTHNVIKLHHVFHLLAYTQCTLYQSNQAIFEFPFYPYAVELLPTFLFDIEFFVVTALILIPHQDYDIHLPLKAHSYLRSYWR